MQNGVCRKPSVIRSGCPHLRRLGKDVVVARHRRLERAERTPSHLGCILVKLLRTISEFGIQDVLPFHDTAAVGRFASHDCGKRAVSDLFRLVDFLALEDGGDEVNVLLHVGINILAGVAPGLTALDLDAADRICCAFASNDGFADRREVTFNLAAVAVHVNATFVFKLNRKVVPDLAGFITKLLACA